MSFMRLEFRMALKILFEGFDFATGMALHTLAMLVVVVLASS